MKLINTIMAVLCITAASSCCQTAEETCCGQKDGTIETIMARRSIRKYKPAVVSRDTLTKIMECGINAPSGMNRQSWEVRVVDKPEMMEKIVKAMAASNPDTDPAAIKGCFRDAPVMIFIANDPSYDLSPIDCGLLSQNIMLSAWSIGVGSVCLGSPVRFLKESEEAQKILGFSEGYEPIICIGLGYAAESPEAKPRDWNKVKFID